MGCSKVAPAPQPAAKPQETVETRDTRASMKRGAVGDYRKEGRFFLMADASGIYALTAICTHRGCTVGAPDADGFDCPCHDSAYDRQGRVTQGPAQVALRHLKVREPRPGAFLVVDTAAEAGIDERL